MMKNVWLEDGCLSYWVPIALLLLNLLEGKLAPTIEWTQCPMILRAGKIFLSKKREGCCLFRADETYLGVEEVGCGLFFFSGSSNVFLLEIMNTPWKINGLEPKNGGVFQMFFLFNWVIFRFHANFRGKYILFWGETEDCVDYP